MGRACSAVSHIRAPISWCSGVHWSITDLARQSRSWSSPGSVSQSLSLDGTRARARGAGGAARRRSSGQLLIEDGVHDGVGGPAEPDAVVQEGGHVAAVAALDEFGVLQGAASQFGHAGGCAFYCLKAGGQVGQHLGAGLADLLGVLVVVGLLVAGGQGAISPE